MMACPICARETLPEYKPFCSRRCADVDLGRWVTGSYRIPVDAEEAPDLPERAHDDDPPQRH